MYMICKTETWDVVPRDIRDHAWDYVEHRMLKYTADLETWSDLVSPEHTDECMKHARYKYWFVQMCYEILSGQRNRHDPSMMDLVHSELMDLIAHMDTLRSQIQFSVYRDRRRQLILGARRRAAEPAHSAS